MFRALAAIGLLTLSAAHARAQTGEKYVVTAKIANAVNGDKIAEDFTFGTTVEALDVKSFNDAEWVKVATKQSDKGYSWIHAGSLRKYQPLTAEVAPRRALPPEVAKLFNDYFAPAENYKDNVSAPALKVIVDDAAKMKTLIGSLQYNLKQLKDSGVADLPADQKVFLTEAIKGYEQLTKGVQAIDGLQKITEEEYSIAWLKDAGLGIFTDVVLPALDVVYPGVGRGAQAVVNASGIRDELRTDKYYMKSLKDFRNKVIAATLRNADQLRIAGTSVWLARTRSMASEESLGITADLRQYKTQAHLGYHGITLVNAFDKPLTNALIQVTIQGENREEAHAYYAAADWKPGQRIVLKCDPKGVEVDKQAFGKTSVKEPKKVLVEVACDQSAKVLTTTYEHSADKARHDLARFLHEDLKVTLLAHTYLTKVLVGTGPSIACSFGVDWPGELAELEKLRDMDVTLIVLAGETVLNTKSDVLGDTRLTGWVKGGMFTIARDELGSTKPDAVVVTLKPKGVDCIPRAVKFAVKID